VKRREGGMRRTGEGDGGGRDEGRSIGGNDDMAS